MCYFQKLGNWQEQSPEVLHTHTYVTDPPYKIITEKLGNGGKIKKFPSLHPMKATDQPPRLGNRFTILHVVLSSLPK